MLLELPFELLQIVLGSLDPYSLSSLSRSHTAFRELTRKSVSCRMVAQYVFWIQAILILVMLVGQSSLWRPYVTEEPSLLLSAAKICLADILKLPPQVEVQDRYMRSCDWMQIYQILW